MHLAHQGASRLQGHLGQAGIQQLLGTIWLCLWIYYSDLGQARVTCCTRRLKFNFICKCVQGEGQGSTMYFLSYQISRQSDWNYPELLLRFCFPIAQNFRIAILFKKIMRFFLPNFWEPPKLFFGSLPKWFFGSLPKFSVLPKCCRLPKFGSLPAFWSLLKLLNVML